MSLSLGCFRLKWCLSRNMKLLLVGLCLWVGFMTFSGRNRTSRSSYVRRPPAVFRPDLVKNRIDGVNPDFKVVETKPKWSNEIPKRVTTKPAVKDWYKPISPNYEGVFENDPPFHCAAFAGTESIKCDRYFGSVLQDPQEHVPDPDLLFPELQGDNFDCTDLEKLTALGGYTEADPMAYIILVNTATSLESLLATLTATSSQRNRHCLIVPDDHLRISAIRSISTCVQTIHTVVQPLTVPGRKEVLDGAFECLEHLQNYEWSYVFTLPAGTLPLKTQENIGTVLKTLNGGNNILLWEPDHAAFRDRYLYKWKEISKDEYDKDPKKYQKSRHIVRIAENRWWYREPSLRQTIPPGGTTLFAGIFSSLLHRDFVEFAQTNPVALKLRRFSETTNKAFETFWATLNFNRHLEAPGSYPGICNNYHKMFYLDKTFLVDYQHVHNYEHPCTIAKFDKCPTIPGQLLDVNAQPSFFSSNLDFEQSSIAGHCQLEYICNQTVLQGLDRMRRKKRDKAAPRLVRSGMEAQFDPLANIAGQEKAIYSTKRYREVSVEFYEGLPVQRFYSSERGSTGQHMCVTTQEAMTSRHSFLKNHKYWQ